MFILLNVVCNDDDVDNDGILIILVIRLIDIVNKTM